MRSIAAVDFFVGPLMTALNPDEIITEIRFPAWPSQRRFGFSEFSRRRGDFALAAAALFYDEDGVGRACNAHVGVIGVGDRPLRLTAVEDCINGKEIDAAIIAKAEAAASVAVEPADDYPRQRRLPQGIGWGHGRAGVKERNDLRGPQSMLVRFEVNGNQVEVEVEPRLTLADCLRHQLRLTGTHVGCEHGVCGACTVLVDGAAVRSCVMSYRSSRGYESRYGSRRSPSLEEEPHAVAGVFPEASRVYPMQLLYAWNDYNSSPHC